MQSSEHPVEIDKSGRDSSDTPFRARVDNMEDVLHEVVHRLNAFGSAIVVNGEDFLFGLRDELFRLGFGIVRFIEDLFARLNELSANRVLLYNFGVVDGVRGNLNGRHEFREILFAADFDKFAARAEILNEQGKVDSGRRRVHFEQTAVNPSVSFQIKVLRSDDCRHVVAQPRI